MAAAALRLKADRELRVWTIARGLDVDGSGYVSEAELTAGVVHLDGVRGLSADYTRRLLRSGDGVFWTLYRKRGALWIRLHGLGAVSLALGVERHYKRPMLIGVDDIARLQSWRGCLLASQLAVKEQWTQPISRAALSAKVGYTGRTQRRWQRAADGLIDRRKNGALLDWDSFCVNGYIDPERLAEHNAYVDKWGGRRRIVQRLPNSYRVNATAARRGILRRVNEDLSGQSLTDGLRGERKPKLFYADGQTKQIARRLQEQTEGDTFYEQVAWVGKRKAKCTASGTWLYGVHSIVNGSVRYG